MYAYAIERIYMERYDVTGMSCAACSARVEKAVSAVPGVTSCSVSLLTNSMSIEGTASQSDVIKAVKDAGYGASVKGAKADDTAQTDSGARDLLIRLIVSAVLTLILMYFSMGNMMFGFPLPAFFEGNHIAVTLVQMILAASVMVINGRFFINGTKGIIHRAPNMDTLVAMGSAASFIWSVYVLFRMTAKVSSGDHAAVMKSMGEFTLSQRR